MFAKYKKKIVIVLMALLTCSALPAAYWVTCSACYGSGTCNKCGGSRVCQTCYGSGVVGVQAKTCELCSGGGACHICSGSGASWFVSRSLKPEPLPLNRTFPPGMIELIVFMLRP